jgi:hypothetical protein
MMMMVPAAWGEILSSMSQGAVTRPVTMGKLVGQDEQEEGHVAVSEVRNAMKHSPDVRLRF